MLNSGSGIMINNSMIPRFVFVILQPSIHNKEAIKTIMFDGKICANGGELSFYTSFQDVSNAYSDKYPESEMWGIGFSLKALKNKAQCECIKIDEAKDGDLWYNKIRTKLIDFKELDYTTNEVFFVAPNLQECENIWFVDKNDKYKRWWCKGVYQGCCDMVKYLDSRNYHPYYRKNYKTISKNELFPNRNLLNDGEVLSHDYSILNLSPKELHEGVEKPKQLNSYNLF